MTYLEMKQKHQDDVDNFPMFFAFSDKQFNEGMKKLGLLPTDTDKIYKLGGTGGFILKSDVKPYYDLLKSHQNELKNKINEDTKGDGFIYDMFYCELNNHEYIITYDTETTLECLRISKEELQKNKALQYGLKKATEKIMQNYEKQNNYDMEM